MDKTGGTTASCAHRPVGRIPSLIVDIGDLDNVKRGQREQQRFTGLAVTLAITLDNTPAGTLDIVPRPRSARILDAGPRPLWAIPTGGNVAEHRAGEPARIAVAALPMAHGNEIGVRARPPENADGDHGAPTM